MPRALEDLTGQLFGTRRVLRQGKSRNYGGCRVAYWTCRCERCGFQSDVQSSSLRRGVGCPKCTRAAQRGPQKTPPQKNRTLKVRQKQLTVGGLQTILRKLPPQMPMRVYLVGDRGWAITEVAAVDVTDEKALLVGTLPDRLERWPAKKRG